MRKPVKLLFIIPIFGRTVNIEEEKNINFILINIKKLTLS